MRRVRELTDKPFGVDLLLSSNFRVPRGKGRVQRTEPPKLPVTLASDAHTPERVGANFDDLIAWARRAGYREAAAFVGRARTEYAIG